MMLSMLQVVYSMLTAVMVVLVGTMIPATAQTLLPNGSECTKSNQCESSCCVQRLFSNNVCNNNTWLRVCVDNDDEDYTFQQGTSLSNCAAAAAAAAALKDASAVLVLSYNLFLLLIAADGIPALGDRADRIGDWFVQSPGNSYDIVALQEVWTQQDAIRNGMIAAGYCHYIYDDRGSFGSGLALFSKYSIVKHEFRAFRDACGPVECLVDKGVSYARIDKDGVMINVFNIHTMFFVQNHDVRRRQFEVMRNFMDEQNIEKELVLMVGDFNEDKVNTPDLYEIMLSDLSADDIELQSTSTKYSMDPLLNNLIIPDIPGGTDAQRALDHVLYDTSDNAVPPGSGSICEYLTPTDAGGNDLSDHYPMSCDIKIGSN